MRSLSSPLSPVRRLGLAAYTLAGSAVIAFVTLLCFRLRLSFPTPTFLCLIVIVVISLRGSFLSSTAVSLIATGFLDYYFIPPLFSFSVSEPADIVTLLAFLTTSTTITRLVSRVRQLMEDKLQMSEAYLSEAQQLSHTGSFGWKTATDKITWSTETFRIFGCDPATTPTVEVILKRVHPEDVPVVKQTIERAALERHDWQLEHRLLLPGGEVKYVSVVARMRSDHPGPCEFVGAIMDVTERRLAEESLRKAQVHLAHVTRLTTVGELTASIAHEVNQPLAAVVTNANACMRWLSREPPNYDEVRQAILRIIRDGTRGGEVIARIRGLVKKDQPPRGLLDVNDVVRETIALALANLQGATLTVELAYDIPKVKADRVLLQQVLLNLLVNAMDAMRTVKDRPQILSIQTEYHEQRSVQVTVQDSGIGLAPNQMENLFEAFYTTKPQGLGMGLSICRSIIESHGGRLWAESKEGSGTILSFTLPVEGGAA